MNNYPYLNDKQFLADFDKERLKESVIRITILDFQTEKALASIEGKCTAGNCNLSGTSNMRRTASCTLVVDPDGILVNGYSDYQQYYNITEIDNLISLSKKIRMEIGFKNTTDKYSIYNVIWFPLGVYVIKNASVTEGSGGINMSLTLSDKCALLNGDVGGTFPAAITFSELEFLNLEEIGEHSKKLLIKDIIKFIVSDFGGENPNNIIITDIDDYIVKIMKWNGKQTVYLYHGKEGVDINKVLTTEERKATNDTLLFPHTSYEKGQNIGYTLEPFVYPGTLECNAGETVASILDKIKNTLGNFEWFYDIDGRFIFRKIKNYLTESLAAEIIQKGEIPENAYLSFGNPSKSVYAFDEDNKSLVVSISSSPQYSNIKNDFIVWGNKKGVSGADIPIRYHLAFDNKPSINEAQQRFALVYTDRRGLQSIIPLKNNYKLYTTAPTTISNKDIFFIFPNNKGEYAVFKYNSELGGLQEHKEYEICYLTTDEWRAELYYRGLWESGTFSSNPYAAELNAEWPKIWNPRKNEIEEENSNEYNFPVYKGGYKDNIDKYDYEYWLDFLEGSEGGAQSISQFNVHSIGRRTKVVNEKDINCLFVKEFPQYVYIETSKGTTEKEQTIAIKMGREVIQVSSDIYKNLSVGGNLKAAFDRIKELIYTHTQYNENINLSVIPIYHLEPNTRITVHDNETGVHGDYLIKTISLPLTTNGTSNISATRCLERTF